MNPLFVKGLEVYILTADGCLDGLPSQPLVAITLSPSSLESLPLSALASHAFERLVVRESVI